MAGERSNLETALDLLDQGESEKAEASLSLAVSAARSPGEWTSVAHDRRRARRVLDAEHG
jgi:hypothetical protein